MQRKVVKVIRDPFNKASRYSQSSAVHLLFISVFLESKTALNKFQVSRKTETTLFYSLWDARIQIQTM